VSTIRPATPADAAACIGLMVEYVAASPYGAFLRAPERHGAALFALCLETGVVLVAEHEGAVVGVLAFTVSDYMGERFAEEIALHVAPGHVRSLLALVGRGIHTARQIGATVVKMSAPSNAVPLERLYGRAGFVAVERVFLTRLSDGPTPDPSHDWSGRRGNRRDRRHSPRQKESARRREGRRDA
jgi:hypothetical protein